MMLRRGGHWFLETYRNTSWCCAACGMYAVIGSYIPPCRYRDLKHAPIISVE